MRVVSTSVKDDHLRVLWGEIGHFISTCKYPLDVRKGGPLVVKHRELRKILNGEVSRKSYAIGQVSERGEGMAGHHALYTLGVIDEASGVDHAVYTQMETWAKRILVFGNCHPCENFFKWAVKGRPGGSDPGGDIPRGSLVRGASYGRDEGSDRDLPPDPGAGAGLTAAARPEPVGRAGPGNGNGGGGNSDGGAGGYFRRVIRITAEDSPNVRLGLEQERRGLVPSGLTPDGRPVVPGVLPYALYKQRRATMTPMEQCVSLDADWWAGAEVLLFPPEWLALCARRAGELKGRHRAAKAIGIDPAEGGDKSVWAVVDEWGLILLASFQTPDTAVVPRITLALAKQYKVPPDKVWFDRGGGGKEHADYLRALRAGDWPQGFRCNTVGFGETVRLAPKRGLQLLETRKEVLEDRYAYFNRRAEMYGELSDRADPVRHPEGFTLPGAEEGEAYAELHRQLAVFPRRYDGEGRLRLPPKNKREASEHGEQSLAQMLGRSPDEADALVIAYHAMTHRPQRASAGAVGYS